MFCSMRMESCRFSELEGLKGPHIAWHPAVHTLTRTAVFCRLKPTALRSIHAMPIIVGHLRTTQSSKLGRSCAMPAAFLAGMFQQRHPIVYGCKADSWLEGIGPAQRDQQTGKLQLCLPAATLARTGRKQQTKGNRAHARPSSSTDSQQSSSSEAPATSYLVVC